MSKRKVAGAPKNVTVSLVDGDPAIRHERQLMLRSMEYDVHSYSTCAALLADPKSTGNDCIILSVRMPDGDALNVLRRLRKKGWRGHAILLDGDDPTGTFAQETCVNGDMFFGRGIGDHQLALAVATSVVPSSA